MRRLGAAECQPEEKDHNTQHNGLIPIKIAGFQCPRPVHSDVSGLVSLFPRGTQLYQITVREGAGA